MKLKIAYFGTPDFSADFLKMILEDTSLPLEIVLVVTQPDQLIGRKKILTPTPVKQLAQTHNIPVWDKKLDDSLTRQLATLDLSLLFAYGEILKKDLLEAPKNGFWNIHPSLLPNYRGTSPMTYPLILGDKITGVTLMKMDQQMDHGPIISQEEVAIDPRDLNTDLQQKSIRVAFDLFKNALNEIYSSKTITVQEQNHAEATYTRFQTKNDGFIPLSVLKKAINGEELTDPEIPLVIKDYYEKNPTKKFVIRNSSFVIFNLFRGLYPWPGIWSLIMINGEEKRLKITDVELKGNKLVIKKVHLEGKNEVDFNQFNTQYSIF